MVFSIHHRLIINAKAEQIFEALTLPKGLNNWWTLEAKGSPILNSTYRFYFGPLYDWQARVIEVTGDKSLTWKMISAMDDWMNTEVGFEIRPEEEGSLVHFFHTGWRSESEHFGITNYCWAQLLRGLKDYVETGKIVPFESRN